MAAWVELKKFHVGSSTWTGLGMGKMLTGEGSSEQHEIFKAWVQMSD